MKNKVKKVFVFGTGRCGSVTISRLFDQIPNVVSLHEGRIVQQKDVNLGDLKEINEFIYYKNLNPIKCYNNSINLKGKVVDEMERLFKPRLNFIESLSDNNIYFDVNPYGYSFINFINEKYPDAKYIHLIRNGYEVVRSYYGRQHTYPDIPENKYKGYRSGKPRPMANNSKYSFWNNYSRFEKTCWFWDYVNSDIEKRLENINSNRKLLLRLEDIDYNNIHKTLDFLEIPYSNKLIIEKLNQGSSNLEWDKKRVQLFNQICKERMIKYGYPIREV